MLVEVDGLEHAVYVETATEWDWPTKTRWYKWMAALRTSDREDLRVLIRSAADVPADVSPYVDSSPRNGFELAD